MLGLDASADGVSKPLVTTHAPVLVPDTGPTGLYARLAERGHRVVRFSEDIEARRPRADEASFLNLTEAQQVLVLPGCLRCRGPAARSCLQRVPQPAMAAVVRVDRGPRGSLLACPTYQGTP